MKPLITAFITLVFLAGCNMAPKVHAVRNASDNGLFQGLDKNTRLSMSYPGAHSGPYGSLDQLNFNIEDGRHQGKKASAIVGKSRKTGAWEVLMILVKEDAQWVSLPKKD